MVSLECGKLHIRAVSSVLLFPSFLNCEHHFIWVLSMEQLLGFFCSIWLKQQCLAYPNCAVDEFYCFIYNSIWCGVHFINSFTHSIIADKCQQHPSTGDLNTKKCNATSKHTFNLTPHRGIQTTCKMSTNTTHYLKYSISH